MGFSLRPIHDKGYRHTADRLTLFRPMTPAGDLKAFAQALAITCFQLSECKRLGCRDLFISVPIEAFDLLEPAGLTQWQTILSLPDDWQVDEDGAEALRRALKKGYQIEVPARSLIGADPGLSDLFSVARVSGADPLDAHELEDLGQRGVKLLVDNVRHEEGLQPFLEADFDYFDARYLASLVPAGGGTDEYHDSKEVHLRLIRELSNEAVQLSQLQDIILQMPETHLVILKMANSARYRRGAYTRHDLRQSIQVLGFTMLRRLIMMLSLSDDTPVSRLKMRMALSRAFLCRCVAKNIRKASQEKAFNVGLFSMIGPLLNARQEDVIDELPIDDEMRNALVSRAGPLGLVLNLVESHEQDLSGPGAADLAKSISKCYLEAICETEELIGLL